MDPIATAANPAIGVLIFVLGGLAGAIFYLPLKNVRNWAWESYWLIYALFALLIVPWALALIQSPNTLERSQSRAEQGAVVLLSLRRGLGFRRSDVGPDDPLPRRRSRPRHRLWLVLGRGYAGAEIITGKFGELLHLARGSPR